MPSATYPWAWSVVPWFDAVAAHRTPVAGRSAWAPQLAEVFVALHRPAADDAPVNPSVASRSARASNRCASGSSSSRSPTGTGSSSAGATWPPRPPWDGPALWLHGDPHPANLLVRDGRLRAVIDFGDMTSGDPASDLSTAWLTFDAEGRAAFRARLAYDDATWRRAQAWALHMAVVLQMHPVDHPHLAEIGRHGITQALID